MKGCWQLAGPVSEWLLPHVLDWQPWLMTVWLWLWVCSTRPWSMYSIFLERMSVSWSECSLARNVIVCSPLHLASSVIYSRDIPISILSLDVHMRISSLNQRHILSEKKINMSIFCRVLWLTLSTASLDQFTSHSGSWLDLLVHNKKALIMLWTVHSEGSNFPCSRPSWLFWISFSQ